MADRGQAGESDLSSNLKPDKVPLEEIALKHLTRWLSGRDTEPGQLVPIRELAKRLDMSRTPLRTALGRLYEQGLVEYRPRVGFTVSIPTVQQIEELFDVRLMMEREAVSRIAAAHPTLDLQPLRETAESMNDMVAYVVENPDAYPQFRDADIAFHRTIFELAGNRRLSKMYDDLHLSVHITRFGWQRGWLPNRFDCAAREHLEIVAALETGDVDLSVQCVKYHIDRVRRSLWNPNGGP